jgi:hypothetical protein
MRRHGVRTGIPRKRGCGPGRTGDVLSRVGTSMPANRATRLSSFGWRLRVAVFGLA